MKKNIHDIIKSIIDIIIEKTDPQQIIMFGSRAKGVAHKGSDIDIALKGAKQLSLREYRKLKEAIEKVSGLYSVDILFMEKIDSDFRDIIIETGVILYEKK